MKKEWVVREMLLTANNGSDKKLVLRTEERLSKMGALENSNPEKRHPRIRKTRLFVSKVGEHGSLAMVEE